MMMEKTVNYDDEPVFYCANCLSLRILEDQLIGDYCMECGSTDIRKTDIEDWEKKYIKKYGVKF